jgi:hypothetical protein
MENIFPICINWLTDAVFALREAGCKLMHKIYDIYKGEEFESKIIAKLNEMKANSNYLIRNTVLFLAKEFSNDEFDSDFLERKLSPLVFRLAKDKVSNVRMNSAGVVKKMLKTVKSKDIMKETLAIHEDLKRDNDIDVINALNDN